MEGIDTRKDHLAWCKARAEAYLTRGDWHEALASFISDLGKHPAYAGGAVQMLGTMMLMGGQINSVDTVRTFIDGTN